MGNTERNTGETQGETPDLQAALGVAHCGGRVGVERAEVAVTRDERLAHREVLRGRAGRARARTCA